MESSQAAAARESIGWFAGTGVKEDGGQSWESTALKHRSNGTYRTYQYAVRYMVLAVTMRRRD